MAKIKANLIKVKVVPRDRKAIPGVLLNNKFIVGEPMVLDLSKKEIQLCKHYADVYDLTSGEEVLIDDLSFKDIVEFVEDTEDEDGEEEEGESEPDEIPADETQIEDEEPAVEDPVEQVSVEEEDEEEIIRRMIEEEEQQKAAASVEE